MSLTRTEAIDEICKMATDAWVTTLIQEATRFKYENVGTTVIPPIGQQPWARLTLRHSVSGQTSLSDERGRRRFTRHGVLTVQVFEPIGQGLVGSTDLPKTINDVFEGKSSPGGIIFRNVAVNEIGESGDFFQTNVVASFEYDEVK